MIWLFPHFIVTGFNYVNVFIDAYRLLPSRNKEIKHGVNLGAYLIVAGACCWVFNMGWQSILFLFSAFFNRQIHFDIPLNLRRGKKWDYVSNDRPPKSWWDRQEIKVFGYNGKLPVFVYGFLWIVTLIIDYYVSS